MAEKAIIGIGGLTFGVYLLHDNDLLRSRVWGLINVPRFLDSLLVEMLYMVAIVVGIFCLGCLVELIRKRIVGIIHIEDILGKYADRLYDSVVQRIGRKLKSEE